MTKKQASTKVVECEHGHLHPDHSKELIRLKRIKGQIEGLEKMVLDRRYCPDIIQQSRAATSALRAFEAEILRTHLQMCVRDALKSKDAHDAEAKIQEIMAIFTR